MSEGEGLPWAREREGECSEWSHESSTSFHTLQGSHTYIATVLDKLRQPLLHGTCNRGREEVSVQIGLLLVEVDAFRALRTAPAQQHARTVANEERHEIAQHAKPQIRQSVQIEVVGVVPRFGGPLCHRQRQAGLIVAPKLGTIFHGKVERF